MDAFPAFFPLTGKRIAIVGAGEQAEAKLRLFEGSPAEVVRIPAGPEALETGAYAGVLIAFIAAPDDAFGEGCAAAARAAGALVNVIDRPHLSDFTMPAIVDRGTVVAGIGTGGASPVLATELRQSLELDWHQNLGVLAELFRRTQAETRSRFPDLAERRRVLRELLKGPAAESALRGELEEAETLARSELAAAAAGERKTKGKVQLLVAPADFDLLSLRAATALSAADRLAYPDIETGSIAFAWGRREAEHSTDIAIASLAAGAKQGLIVLALLPQADPVLAAALRAEGVEVESLPTGAAP